MKNLSENRQKMNHQSPPKDQSSTINNATNKKACPYENPMPSAKQARRRSFVPIDPIRHPPHTSARMMKML